MYFLLGILITTTTTFPLDSKDVNMDVDRAPNSQKNVESSFSIEVCEEAIMMAQGSEINMVVLPNAVADMESSKISSPATQEADVVLEDKLRSPILGLILLHNEEKVEIRGSFPKGTPKV